MFYEDLSHKPHVLKQILDSRTKLLRSKQIRHFLKVLKRFVNFKFLKRFRQFKVKWMDKPIKDATCERGNEKERKIYY